MKQSPKSTLCALSFLLVFGLYSCSQKQASEETAQNETEAPVEEEAPEEITYDVNDVASIIEAVEMASGSWDKLWEQKDVEYTYTYASSDGKKDVSLERYIFDNENSWGKYSAHQINVLPEAEGEVIQCYIDNKPEISLNGEKMEGPEVIGGTEFLRKVNYFWFAMNFKLGDPGTSHEYMGQEEVNGVTYDKVGVSYDSETTGKPENDSYIVYVNPETKLIDRFFFSLPAWGVQEAVLLMEVDYTEMNGLQLPLVRRAYIPNEQGEYPETASVTQTSENIKFNNGFTVEDFSI
ncbi:MAG: hypothetical protein AAF363_03285 [Bacteroidota bacterium]